MSYIHPGRSAVRYKAFAGDPLTYAVPSGVPDPVIWFSPRDVTLNGSDQVTDIQNMGTGGATYDASYISNTHATLATPVGWGGRAVFDLDNSPHSYGFNGTTGLNTRTVYTFATFGDGTPTTFNIGDHVGLISGPLGGADTDMELIGQNGTNAWFSSPQRPDRPLLDGVEVANGANIFPINKTGLGAVRDPGLALGSLWQDNFSVTRHWFGYTGDIMFWDVTLTPAQILDVHNMLVDFYAEPVLLAAADLNFAVNPSTVNGVVTFNFDNAVLDYNLGLSLPTTQVTAPAGTKYAIVSGHTRSGTFDGNNFHELRITKNGTTVAKNIFHDGRFSTVFVSGVFDCVEGDNFSLVMNANYVNTLIGGQTNFKVAFYG